MGDHPWINLYRVDPKSLRQYFFRGCCAGNVSAVKSCLAYSSFDPNELIDPGRSDWLGKRIMSSGIIEGCYADNTNY